MGHISFLDPQGELPVNEDLWVVALLRKPYGANPEHTFIMVEGCTPGGQVYFIRYDLILDNDNPDFYQIHLSDPKNALLSQAPRILSEFLNDDNIAGQGWPIAKSKAKELHDIVLKEKANPGTYNLLGDEALFPHTIGVSYGASPNVSQFIVEKINDNIEAISGVHAAVKSQQILKPSGQNCFTWARKVLLLLKIPDLERALPWKAEELVASITSHHVKSAAESQSGTREKCRIM